MDYDVCTSLPAMFFANTAEIGDRGFLWERRDGAWQAFSGTRVRRDAAALAGALKSASSRGTGSPLYRRTARNG